MPLLAMQPTPQPLTQEDKDLPMKRHSLTALFLTLLIAGLFSAGCVTKAGDRLTSTNFAYPNSNVTPLGKVEASTPTKFNIFFPRTMSRQNVLDLRDSALAQAPGADILINVRTDTSVTMFPYPIPMYWTKSVIKGTAAKMAVGEQDLQENLGKMKY